MKHCYCNSKPFLLTDGILFPSLQLFGICRLNAAHVSDHWMCTTDFSSSRPNMDKSERFQCKIIVTGHL